MMFDSGARSSYLCIDVVTKLNLRPVRKEHHVIEQMLEPQGGTMTYSVTESYVVEGFSLEVECINAEKGILTYLPNPNVQALRKQHGRLRWADLQQSRDEEQLNSSPYYSWGSWIQRIRMTEPLRILVLNSRLAGPVMEDKILSECGFSLHNWHSNLGHLDSAKEVCDEETYAKTIMGNQSNSKTKILGNQ